MLAPKLRKEVGYRVKNVCLICTICASKFQNLCFHPSPTIPKTSFGGWEYVGFPDRVSGSGMVSKIRT